jgi:hypothetical protein
MISDDCRLKFEASSCLISPSFSNLIPPLVGKGVKFGVESPPAVADGVAESTESYSEEESITSSC